MAVDSQNIGKYFEKLFIQACHIYGVTVYRLPDFGAKKIQQNKTQITKIICDFILGYEDKLFLIDTKSMDKVRLRHSLTTKPTFRNQITELNKVQQNLTAHRTGFVVQYRPLDTVVFYTAQQLQALQPNNGLTVEEGLVLSTNNELPNLRLIFAQ